MEKVGAFTDRATDAGEWRSGNPGTGQTATPMLAGYFNMLQREMVAVVEAVDIELDKGDDGQLLQAIRRLRGGAATNFGQWLWSASTAGNPGAGRIALNNVEPSDATTLFIDVVSSEEMDFAQSIGLLRAGDTLTFQAGTTAELAQRFRVTGAAVAMGAYHSLPVEYVSGAGGLPAEGSVTSVLLTLTGASIDQALLIRVAALEARPRGIGDGQSWVDVTANRAMDTVYTNSTGRTIVVHALTYHQAAATSGLYLNGLLLSHEGASIGGGVFNNLRAVLSAEIPAGATYKVSPISGSVAVEKWLELR